MKYLILHVKKKYFDQIRNEEKSFEYRLQTKYWKKRLVGRRYAGIKIYCGYPKSTDGYRILLRKWVGYGLLQTITHEHFGPEPVDVFSIPVCIRK